MPVKLAALININAVVIEFAAHQRQTLVTLRCVVSHVLHELRGCKACRGSANTCVQLFVPVYSLYVYYSVHVTGQITFTFETRIKKTF